MNETKYFFPLRDPTRKGVLSKAKSFVNDMISPSGPSWHTNKLITDAKLYGTFLKKQSNYYDITRSFHETYAKIVDLLVRRHRNVTIPMGQGRQNVDGLRYVVEISALLKKFEAVYRRNYKRDDVKESIPNTMKNVAKKFKIRLTKTVNGVRVKLTKNELKNAIWTKTHMRFN